MHFSKNFLPRLCLWSFLFAATLAVPVSEPDTDLAGRDLGGDTSVAAPILARTPEDNDDYDDENGVGLPGPDPENDNVPRALSDKRDGDDDDDYNDENDFGLAGPDASDGEFVTRDVNVTEAVELVKRRPGDSYINPIDVVFDITRWPNIAEENAYAMLCLRNKQRTYRRNHRSQDSRTHYTESGANNPIFDANRLQTYHTAQISRTTTSREEFPWRSTQQGGVGAYLFPATPAEQDSQGGNVNGGYSRYRVRRDDWFRINFQPVGLFGEYGKHLFLYNDDSICRKKTITQRIFNVAKVNLRNFVWQKDQTKRGPRNSVIYNHVYP